MNVPHVSGEGRSTAAWRASLESLKWQPSFLPSFQSHWREFPTFRLPVGRYQLHISFLWTEETIAFKYRQELRAFCFVMFGARFKSCWRVHFYREQCDESGSWIKDRGIGQATLERASWRNCKKSAVFFAPWALSLWKRGQGKTARLKASIVTNTELMDILPVRNKKEHVIIHSAYIFLLIT